MYKKHLQYRAKIPFKEQYTVYAMYILAASLVKFRFRSVFDSGFGSNMINLVPVPVDTFVPVDH